MNKNMKNVNDSLDKIVESLTGMAESTEEFMPLVADSLRHTVKLVKLYKKAFNEGLKK